MHSSSEIYLSISVAICFLFWMIFMFRDIKKHQTDIKKYLLEIQIHQEKQNKRIDHLYQICVEMLGMRHKH